MELEAPVVIGSALARLPVVGITGGQAHKDKGIRNQDLKARVSRLRTECETWHCGIHNPGSTNGIMAHAEPCVLVAAVQAIEMQTAE